MFPNALREFLKKKKGDNDLVYVIFLSVFFLGIQESDDTKQ
jgi:hypothetical protein